MEVPAPVPMKTPYTGAVKISIASWEDNVKLADNSMWHCICQYHVVPVACISKTAETRPGFLASGPLSSICAIREQELNAIRKRWKTYEASIAHQGHPESHVHGDIVGPA